MKNKICIIFLLSIGFIQYSVADDLNYVDEIVVTADDNIWPKEKMDRYRSRYVKQPPLMFSVYEYTFGGALGIFYYVAESTYFGVEFRQIYNYHKINAPNYYTNPYLPMQAGFGIVSINIRF